MKTISRRKFAAVAVLPLIGALLSALAARADEIKVVTSGGFTAAYLELVPEYESATHNKLVTEFGPSMGTTHNAIPVRLERGEAIDVVIMAAPALDDLIKQGKVRADSRVDLVQSKIGDGRQGRSAQARHQHRRRAEAHAAGRKIDCAIPIAPAASISPLSCFRSSASPTRSRARAKKIEADPVGGVVATGEFEIGFQQISELRPVKGIDIVGELPPGAQRVTVFAAGIPTTARIRRPPKR